MNNYFELYDMPVTFNPDPETVKAKYYELSRKYHPDRFTQADTKAQLEALAMAAQNNLAYKTLGNSDATMAYVLRLNGLLETEEKYNLPPNFLMDMMDLNEALSDYEMNPIDAEALHQAQQTLANNLEAWQNMAAPLTATYTHDAPDTALLLTLKDLYFRKKYLLRIQERMAKFAAR